MNPKRTRGGERICPICKGKGKIYSPKQKFDVEGMAKVLNKAGYSQRQIAKFLNFKSANTINYYLKK